ncbi:MAG: hypothetical protein A2Z21_03975 [Candidatus Fraserbacteria bacterium RBG_16_55_9]|uniref:Methyltransferase domain-containing protein n=1 Tax=Fraserbacteria sp. (strain RBG_16_55_9) TaxID=1817864 RepID=A0A1F5UYR7_FRAXR|nr:MAG: hypothetical protein A2Z21_03975 [Candidatus Fraserbacteria bacterium RBG_16_55_9]
MHYQKSAAFYDAIYAIRGKDYAQEAKRLHELVRQHKKSMGNSLLDVACGTGIHISLLRNLYDAEGLDLDKKMLKVARKRCPGVVFHHGDMVNFKLACQYDVITCLFSSIGYAKTVGNLRKTVKTFARHLKPGGVAIIEPWFTPEAWRPGSVHATFVDQQELKIARINISERKRMLAVMNMHYLVGTPQGVTYFAELHEMGLFTHEEYLEAFRESGLEVVHDSEGLMGRGLYIGIKSE